MSFRRNTSPASFSLPSAVVYNASIGSLVTFRGVPVVKRRQELAANAAGQLASLRAWSRDRRAKLGLPPEDLESIKDHVVV
jgi:hypothetical protein